MKNMANLIFFFLIAFSKTVYSNEIGSLKDSDLISLTEERIHNLIASSAEIRLGLNVGRKVAGMTKEESEIANEYQDLMKSDDNVDYLELSSNLEN